MASALGGAARGVAAAAIRLPLVFLIPAALGLLAVIGLAVLSASFGRGTDGVARYPWELG